jgi:hypothetical protein
MLSPQGLVDALSVLPWFRDRVKVERSAAEIREYESYQIPGLLQTEDYARAVISAARPMLADDVIERAVALRMTRWQRLSGRLPRRHTERALARLMTEGH